jgi:probable rRNA maturation factor
MARRVVRAECPDVDEVSIVVGDDDLLAELNAQYRHKPRPTDVLSFPLDSDGPYRVLGEVVISVDRVLDQAVEYEHSPAEEMTRLLVHGLLHLVSHEHDSAAGGRRMRQRERECRDELEPWVAKLEAAYAAT